MINSHSVDSDHWGISNRLEDIVVDLLSSRDEGLVGEWGDWVGVVWIDSLVSLHLII